MALRRGNATSLAPIIKGTMKFEKPVKTGMPTKKIIVVPCKVNNWLNICGLTKSFLGTAN